MNTSHFQPPEIMDHGSKTQLQVGDILNLEMYVLMLLPLRSYLIV